MVHRPQFYIGIIDNDRRSTKKTVFHTADSSTSTAVCCLCATGVSTRDYLQPDRHITAAAAAVLLLVLIARGRRLGWVVGLISVFYFIFPAAATSSFVPGTVLRITINLSFYEAS